MLHRQMKNSLLISFSLMEGSALVTSVYTVLSLCAAKYKYKILVLATRRMYAAVLNL